MESRVKYILMMSSICVMYVITLTSAAQTNICLLQCMRGVLKCKRAESVGIPAAMDCCDQYKMCYFTCEPDATTEPPCSSAKGKRGSWNKRLAFAGSWNKRRPVSELEDILGLEDSRQLFK